MKILYHIFGKKTPNSTTISAEIDRATAELATIHGQLPLVMDGIATMTDEQHVEAETKGAALKRAACRLEARITELKKAHAEALSAEAEAERLAAEQRFQQRVEAARHAVEVEAVTLLREYDTTAAKMGDILARLDEINAEANAVNEAGRRTPGFDSVRSTDTAHRKQPDRRASERREMRPMWVSVDSLSGAEEVRFATLDAEGNPIKMSGVSYDSAGRPQTWRLDRREVVTARSGFRHGNYENPLSEIHLPPGFAGGSAHWPRKP